MKARAVSIKAYMQQALLAFYSGAVFDGDKIPAEQKTADSCKYIA